MIQLRNTILIGYPDYIVDVSGRIFRREERSKEIKQYVGFGGYLWVNLKKDGKYCTKAVAPLVLASFNGLKPEGTECCHGELGKRCNFLSNLSWKTHRKNCSEDIIRDGTILRGEKNKRSKLTKDKVSKIRELAKNKSYTQLSILFGVHRLHIRNIIKRKYWNYV